MQDRQPWGHEGTPVNTAHVVFVLVCTRLPGKAAHAKTGQNSNCFQPSLALAHPCLAVKLQIRAGVCSSCHSLTLGRVWLLSPLCVLEGKAGIGSAELRCGAHPAAGRLLTNGCSG